MLGILCDTLFPMRAIVFILFLGLFQAAYAGDFEDAAAAAQKGDYQTAYRLWKPFAEQGNSGAQNILAWMYENGEGVPQDNKEAVKWYRLAAEQENASAQYNLGLMYAYGHGVIQDYIQAHAWWDLAASQGDEMATKNRDKVADLMTPDQIAEAQALAREWAAKYNQQ